jgi:hypothetical protein
VVYISTGYHLPKLKLMLAAGLPLIEPTDKWCHCIEHEAWVLVLVQLLKLVL